MAASSQPGKPGDDPRAACPVCSRTLARWSNGIMRYDYCPACQEHAGQVDRLVDGYTDPDCRAWMQQRVAQWRKRRAERQKQIAQGG